MANVIIRYKVVQTGPNTHEGGLKNGCIICEYQGSLYIDVTTPPIEDAKKAINAAEIAFESWAKVSPRDKSVILRKAYELFMDKIEHFDELITLENGKAYGDAKGEALYSAEFFRWYSEEAVRGIGQISHAPATGARIVVQYKPIGISVLVTPWNYPAAMGTRKIAPAIAA